MQRNMSMILMSIFIIVIIVSSIIIVILYLATDLFKSKELLFKEYISQNIENIVEIIDVSNERQYLKTLQENDYKETSDIKLTYLKNESDEEEIYNIKENGIVNNTEQASYRTFLSTFDENDIFKIETLKQDNIYGIRFSNLVKQFVSVENSNLSYLISSIGYDGKYFSEKLSKTDLSDILEFSDEEIKALKGTYINLIFKDIDKSNYSSKRNSIITLANDQSLTTTAYILSINKSELDKIYRRVLNQAINDSIIIGKIENLEKKIKEMGLLEKEGESLKERYISNLKEIYDNIEYVGENNAKINFKVFQVDGVTVRTEIATDEIIIDIDIIKPKASAILKIQKLTDEGIDVEIYSFNKEMENQTLKRNFSYKSGSSNIEVELDNIGQEKKIQYVMNLKYSGKNINKLEIDSNTEIEIGKSRSIPKIFNEKNNIVLNDYDGNRIISILKNLKSRQINNLEKVQANIKTKMLNNILNWIDEKEQEYERNQLNDKEKQKQKFNNKFELYAGKDLSYQHIQKLIKAISNNMTDYKVIDNNILEIYIKSGEENEEKADKIAKAIKEKNTYTVEIKYSDEGWVNAIDISVYKK